MTSSALRAANVPDNRLLQAMAEELKTPLLKIAREAELNHQEGIETSATQALWFVDSYLLGQQLAQQPHLELEPVAVSAVLQDVAHALDGIAKQYNCGLQLQISGKFAPAMAHQQALRTALLGLGSTLITASQNPQSTLVLAAHRSRGGIVTGVFSQTDGLTQAVYQRGRQLYGRAKQPMQEFTGHSGAGVFMADTLFNSMDSALRVARHHKLTGLAATLQQSRQLALI